MQMKRGSCCALFVLTCFFSGAQNPGDTLFASSFIHNINILLPQPNFWDSLMYYKQHADSFNLGTQYMKGDVTVDGTLITSIGVKLKGNSSFGYPGQKKPIKISFNEYVNGQKLEGLSTINLNNNVLDPTMMREKLLLDFMNKKGLPAPRCTYARVYYNGQYVGLYKMVEEINKQFISTRFSNWGGNLFKGDPQGSLTWMGSNPALYYPYYELQSNTTANNWADLVNLIDNINNTPAANFYDTLETQLNTLSFIRQWAARNLFVDLDAYYHAPHNYYLYHNTLNGQFEWATWDVSVAFGFYPFWSQDSTTKTSILMSYFPLTNRMLADTAYKTRYFNTICDYLDYFSNQTLDPLIDSIGNRIRADIYAESDSNQMFPEFCFEYGMDTLSLSTPMGDIPGLKEFIAARRNFVVNELSSLAWVCPLISVKEPDVQGIALFPNPFSDVFILSPVHAHGRYEIFDLVGRKVLEGYLPAGNNARIDASSLPAGTYVLRVSLDKGVFMKKLTKL